MPKNKVFLNKETFAAQTPYEEINDEDRLILDSYFFDINELVSYAKCTPDKIFSNPHRGAGEFSEEAITLMKQSHPELKAIITNKNS